MWLHESKSLPKIECFFFNSVNVLTRVKASPTCDKWPLFYFLVCLYFYKGFRFFCCLVGGGVGGLVYPEGTYIGLETKQRTVLEKNKVWKLTPWRILSWEGDNIIRYGSRLSLAAMPTSIIDTEQHPHANDQSHLSLSNASHYVPV